MLIPSIKARNAKLKGRTGQAGNEEANGKEIGGVRQNPGQVGSTAWGKSSGAEPAKWELQLGKRAKSALGAQSGIKHSVEKH